MSNIFVRKMSLDDLEKINSIGLENFDDFWNINTLRSELSKSDIMNHFIKKGIKKGDLFFSPCLFTTFSFGS